jgi:hypothetical protein
MRKSILFVAVTIVVGIALFYYGTTMWDLIANEILNKQ